MTEDSNQRPHAKNIQPAPPGTVKWDCTDPTRSLIDLLVYVEGESKAAIDWYWRNKRWKGRLSRFIQFSAIALTAAGGIMPIVWQMLRNSGSQSRFDSGLWASLFVGIAAALLGLDKAFGLSSGWARYVLTATSIQKALAEFRLDWILLMADVSQPPKPEQVTALIKRARDFLSNTQGLVLQETKDWVAEFQSNMASLEKDVKIKLDALSAQAEKAAQAAEAASKPGAIELTVSDADKTDGFKFHVNVANQLGVLADDTVMNAKKWVRLNTAPATYRTSVSADVNGKPIATDTVVDVKPGETAKPVVTLLG